MLTSRIGIALYLLLPNHWVRRRLSADERASIDEGDRYHNTHRSDYADPERYQGGFGFDSPNDPRRDNHRRQLVAFLDSVRPTSVLEVGPGSGHLTRVIVNHPAVRRYVGVDLNPAFLDYLRPRLARVQKADFSFNLLPGRVHAVEEEGFDAAILLSSMHHIPDREALFRALAAHLSRPGHVFAIDPTHYLLRLYKMSRKVMTRGYLDSKVVLAREGRLSTHAMCQLSEYRALARRTGFQIARVHFDDHPRRVRRWRAMGVPLGPFWRWTAQEMTVECVYR